jgi:hypothetical protein
MAIAGRGSDDEAVEMIPKGILASENGDSLGIGSHDEVDMVAKLDMRRNTADSREGILAIKEVDLIALNNVIE